MGSAERKERKKESQDEENHLVVDNGGGDPHSASKQPGVDGGGRGVQGGATQGGETNHRGSARFHEGHRDQRRPRLGKVLAGVGGGQPLLKVHQHLHGVDHRRQVHKRRSSQRRHLVLQFERL